MLNSEGKRISYAPADIAAVLQGVGSFVGALAVAYAAVRASMTYDDWRKQKLAERKIEQAERILTAAYNARRALDVVRSPFMSARELHAAEAHLETQGGWATSSRKEELITAQAHFNRLNSVLNERRAVEECLPMARALFGERVEAALETLNRQFYLVSVAAKTLSSGENDREVERSMREDLSSVSLRDKPNKMNLLIQEQVKLIEDACLPVLRFDVRKDSL